MEMEMETEKRRRERKAIRAKIILLSFRIHKKTSVLGFRAVWN